MEFPETPVVSLILAEADDSETYNEILQKRKFDFKPYYETSLPSYTEATTRCQPQSPPSYAEATRCCKPGELTRQTLATDASTSSRSFAQRSDVKFSILDRACSIAFIMPAGYLSCQLMKVSYALYEDFSYSPLQGVRKLQNFCEDSCKIRGMLQCDKKTTTFEVSEILL